jgi:hypothetical protein
MVRRIVGGATAAVFALAISSGIAFAGQPGAECGAAGAELMPAGFSTSGFGNAEANYAGSDGTASLANANSSHAVSQYDIACVHYTQARS